MGEVHWGTRHLRSLTLEVPADTRVRRLAVTGSPARGGQQQEGTRVAIVFHDEAEIVAGESLRVELSP